MGKPCRSTTYGTEDPLYQIKYFFNIDINSQIDKYIYKYIDTQVQLDTIDTQKQKGTQMRRIFSYSYKDRFIQIDSKMCRCIDDFNVKYINVQSAKILLLPPKY